MAKLKKLTKQIDNIPLPVIEGIARLSNHPDMKYLYAFIRLKKFDILKKHFEYPFTDPVKNALDKAVYVGRDEGMKIISDIIKRAPDLLDKLEEENEK